MPNTDKINIESYIGKVTGCRNSAEFSSSSKNSIGITSIEHKIARNRCILLVYSHFSIERCCFFHFIFDTWWMARVCIKFIWDRIKANIFSQPFESVFDVMMFGVGWCVIEQVENTIYQSSSSIGLAYRFLCFFPKKFVVRRHKPYISSLAYTCGAWSENDRQSDK